MIRSILKIFGWFLIYDLLRISVSYYDCTFALLQDPSGSRLAQWLNQKSKSGLVSLEFSLVDDAVSGSYYITGQTDLNVVVVQWFSVDEYGMSLSSRSIFRTILMYKKINEINYHVHALNDRFHTLYTCNTLLTCDVFFSGHIQIKNSSCFLSPRCSAL